MGNTDEFKDYLRNKGIGELSIQKYIGAFSVINSIAEKYDLSNIDHWNLSNIENNIELIKKDEEFISRNKSGNNMYSASLNHFQKYISSQEKSSENINEMKTPEMPFDTFGWKWATTGIASHLNSPKSLKVVLDALLINGSGENNSNKTFKDLIRKLCINKYGINESESDKLTKLSNSDPHKNIIENSASYWYHIGLLSETGKFAKVSDLGIDYLNGVISNDEFIIDRIKDYKLPHPLYNDLEVKKWHEFDIEIFPLKLIQDIFLELHDNYLEDQQYLTENDLINIVIPCSYDLEKFNIDFIAQHIIEFRKNPSIYSDWPKPQSTYIDDKGDRMANEFLYFLEAFSFLSSNKEYVRANDKKYFATEKLIPNDKFSEKKDKQEINTIDIKQENFKISDFKAACGNAGLIYSNQLLTRFAASLATKPFVLLTGLSGSGKTKLAQAFAQWICHDENQYCIVPIGADWTNRDPLLGYPNALEKGEYVKPDNKVLDVIIKANNNSNLPYFLILDEMNMSHVERYFADFLSVMESKEKISLYSDEIIINNGIPSYLSLPPNLFIIGTVNIDETTYMFSPKVLDRANTIEFRVTKDEIEKFFLQQKDIDMDELSFKGISMANGFLGLAKNTDFSKLDIKLDEIHKTLTIFFEELKKVGAEFGYRSASEMIRLIKQLSVVDGNLKDNEKLDIAIMQKLLPKLHGSRRKLLDYLVILGGFCVDEKVITNVVKDVFNNEGFEFNSVEDIRVKYPLSLEKINRMYNGAIQNGFTSYAEA